MNSPIHIMQECTSRQKTQITVFQRWIVQSLFILAQNASANYKKRQDLKHELHQLRRRIEVIEGKLGIVISTDQAT